MTWKLTPSDIAALDRLFRTEPVQDAVRRRIEIETRREPYDPDEAGCVGSTIRITLEIQHENETLMYASPSGAGYGNTIPEAVDDLFQNIG